LLMLWLATSRRQPRRRESRSRQMSTQRFTNDAW